MECEIYNCKEEATVLVALIKKSINYCHLCGSKVVVGGLRFMGEHYPMTSLETNELVKIHPEARP